MNPATDSPLLIQPDFLRRHVLQMQQRLQRNDYLHQVTPFFLEWFPYSFYGKQMCQEFSSIHSFQMERSRETPAVIAARMQTIYQVRLGAERLPMNHQEVWIFWVQMKQLLLHHIDVA